MGIISGVLQLVASGSIWNEYYEQPRKPDVQALLRRYGVTQAEIIGVLREIFQACELVRPVGEAPACRDEDDRMYLHCATFANVPWLVTRDKDILDESDRLVGVTILGPEEFVATVEGQGIVLPLPT